MFGFKKDTSKVKVRTAKGGGPIRKVKFQIGVGTVLLVMSHLGLKDMLPPELVEPVARFSAEGISLLLVAVGYWTRPAPEDGVEVN